jgi:hypothetical protein
MRHWSWILLAVVFLPACQPTADTEQNVLVSEGSDEGFRLVLEKHLEAVANKNFTQLKETVPENGELVWILPNGGSFMKVEEFLENHEAWFQDTSWTMTTKIVQADWGQDYGTAVVEADLREPERNGKPYFHRMFISYGLKKVGDDWKVVLDHASTIEKSE